MSAAITGDAKNLNRKKRLKGLTQINSSTELSIDNSITLSQLKKIFVTKDDFEILRKDQDDRHDCTQKAVAKLCTERSEILEKFLQYRKDEKARRRESCWS